MKPGSLGQRRRYTCDDCGKVGLYKAIEFTRAGKPKCWTCGCTRLTPSENAAKEIRMRHAKSTEMADRIDAQSPGRDVCRTYGEGDEG